MIEIPLNSSAEQVFSIIINGKSYDLRVIVNTVLEHWSIDVSSEGVELANGVALLGGTDIFRQYTFPINNALVLNIDNPSLDPTIDNLGTVAKLIIFTDEEAAGA